MDRKCYKPQERKRKEIDPPPKFKNQLLVEDDIRKNTEFWIKCLPKVKNYSLKNCSLYLQMGMKYFTKK